jgi:hypothetical protein
MYRDPQKRKSLFDLLSEGHPKAARYPKAGQVRKDTDSPHIAQGESVRIGKDAHSTTAWKRIS